eukprot:COSAG06_NODE_58826_length_276_cov_0.576271_1_plen_35_part_10
MIGFKTIEVVPLVFARLILPSVYRRVHFMFYRPRR